MNEYERVLVGAKADIERKRKAYTPLTKSQVALLKDLLSDVRQGIARRTLAIDSESSEAWAKLVTPLQRPTEVMALGNIVSNAPKNELLTVADLSPIAHVSASCECDTCGRLRPKAAYRVLLVAERRLRVTTCVDCERHRKILAKGRMLKNAHP